uniref:Uncharacterized protein n=1 Tax=Brassica oleracea var. oleracea TaxID=109376 RepID=A0A0D3E597_BRAOL
MESCHRSTAFGSLMRELLSDNGKGSVAFQFPAKYLVDIAERNQARFSQDMGLFTYLRGRIRVIVTG